MPKEERNHGIFYRTSCTENRSVDTHIALLWKGRAAAFCQKSGSGLRIFSDSDLGWLAMIECLKETGMPLKGIKQYIDWFIEGDSTLQNRLDMFRAQKTQIEEQIAQLQKHMEKINYKIKLYEEAVKKGSLDIASANKRLREESNRLFNEG